MGKAIWDCFLPVHQNIVFAIPDESAHKCYLPNRSRYQLCRSHFPAFGIGLPCNRRNLFVGLHPDQVLIEGCQSGVWKKASGSAGGTGLRGMFAPLAGKQISCQLSSGDWAYALVDSLGTPYLYNVRTGAWLLIGYYASTPYTGQVTAAGLVATYYDPFSGMSSFCTASWPVS